MVGVIINSVSHVVVEASCEVGGEGGDGEVTPSSSAEEGC